MPCGAPALAAALADERSCLGQLWLGANELDDAMH